MPHSVHAVEVFDVHDESSVLVNSIVSLTQSKDGEIGEHVDEYFVGNLEYWEVMVGSKVC